MISLEAKLEELEKYQKFFPLRDPKLILENDPSERKIAFWNKEIMPHFIKIKENGCHEWIGKKTYKYGRNYIGVAGYHKLIKKHGISSHRLSWIVHNGSIPDGICVCHKCDNPPCCNPDHLFLGTHKENIQDCVKKGRFKKGDRTRAGLVRLPAMYVSKALRDALRAQAEQSRTPEATVRRIALAAYLTDEVSKW